MAESMLKKLPLAEKSDSKSDSVREIVASTKSLSNSQQETNKKTEKVSVKQANTSKTAPSGTAGSRGTTDINKEIGMILKEINSNLMQQGEDL